MKNVYTAPQLTTEGSVEALTAEVSKTAPRLDKDFPTQTPRKKLTFS